MPDRPDFTTFYHEHYLAEHQNLPNIILHAIGTIAGLALLFSAAFLLISPWWLLAFPIVHAAPGLLGHRLFERSEAVGDVRVTRTDFPPHWFIAANHIYLWQSVTGRNK
jgi:hypothetical protein